MQTAIAKTFEASPLIPQGKLVLFPRPTPARGYWIGQRRPTGRNELRVLFLSLLSFSTAMVMALTVSLFTAGEDNLPTVHSPESTSWYSWLPGNRGDEDSISRLMQNREFSSKVAFVAEIIGKNTRQVDAGTLARTIVRESHAAGLDPLFVASVIKSESAFRKNARSSAGALGLMQVLPNTGKYISGLQNLGWYGSWKLTDPTYNVRVGSAYIKYLNEKFRGNTEHVLIAYNWGPNNLLGALKNRSRIPGSTVKYAKTIIGTHKSWKNDFVRSKTRLQYQEAQLTRHSSIG